jgi:hypothetical protein
MSEFNCNYCGTNQKAHPHHDCIDVLNARVSTLTAENAALLELLGELANKAAWLKQFHTTNDPLEEVLSRVQSALEGKREWIVRNATGKEIL